VINTQYYRSGWHVTIRSSEDINLTYDKCSLLMLSMQKVLFSETTINYNLETTSWRFKLSDRG
jgi:hypothetical protein